VARKERRRRLSYGNDADERSPEDLSQVSRGSERIPEAGILVIFGASGDLTKRKLLPALFHLEQAKLLPENFAIVGVARRALAMSLPRRCARASSSMAAWK